MRGAPWPAGRISNSRCGAFSLVLPMRPSVVPPRTRAPLTSGLATKSFGLRPSGAPAEAVSVVATCASPPLASAFLRSGWANRRTLATGATLGAGVAFGVTLASALDSCSVVTLAAGRPRRRGVSSEAFISLLEERCLGEGKVLATFLRCPYVYVLP